MGRKSQKREIEELQTERKREEEYRMKNQQNSVYQKRRVRENTEIANTGGNGRNKTG